MRTGIPSDSFFSDFFHFFGVEKDKEKSTVMCDIWKMEDILLFLLLTRESPFSLSSRDLV
tara:strand:+ start:558 stop:737 length:180 start_codon:yes stop_codon:yes gene_type:complete